MIISWLLFTGGGVDAVWSFIAGSSLLSTVMVWGSGLTMIYCLSGWRFFY